MMVLLEWLILKVAVLLLLRLDGESLVNSMLNFEGSFYCATRDGFLVRFFKPGLLVTSKKVSLSNILYHCWLAKKKLLVNDRNNSAWSVFVYEEDFLCIPMYFDSLQFHLLFPSSLLFIHLD